MFLQWYTQLSLINPLQLGVAIVSTSPIIMGDLTSELAKILWGQNFFVYLWGDTSVGGVLLSAPRQKEHFFKKSQHHQKWSVSFKNFFRSCDLPIASNLLKMSFRTTSLFVLNLTGVTEKIILLAAYSKLLL